MIKIVKAGECHVPAISKLWWEFMQYTEDIDPIIAMRDGTIPLFEKEHLYPGMKSENSLVMVALDGEKVVGYSYSLIEKPSSLEKRENYGYVHDMFITKDYRRRGIGEKMYTEILKWFHSRGIGRIELGVIPGNRAACSFWKKHGFKAYRRTLFKSI